MFDKMHLKNLHFYYYNCYFKGTHSSEVGTLKLRQWNYIAVVYNYGEGE